ncbi:MAG: ABC transporter permease [Spirochaetaceae bacterium]|nr:ABC transporter permease [Spirochaetaceae bacterium]
MTSYIIKRIFQSLLTVFIVVIAVFLLLRLMPTSGYFTREDYINMTEGMRNAYLKTLGITDNPLIQLKNFFLSTFKGDLGRSITVYPKLPITTILAEKIPYSLYFGLVSMVISVFFGFSLGILMARFKDKWPDHLGTAFVVAVRAIPSLIYLFLIQIWVTGLFRWPMVFYSDRPVSWILPVFSLSITGIAWYGIWLRRFMVDEENRDYIKFARSKGLSQKYIMRHHVLRNAVVPLIQYLPVQLLLTIAGSLIIESIYSIPGMGGLLVYAIKQQDNNLVQVLVLIYAVLGVAGVFVGDLLMAFVDPRIRLAGKKRKKEVTSV